MQVRPLLFVNCKIEPIYFIVLAWLMQQPRLLCLLLLHKHLSLVQQLSTAYCNAQY